MILQNAAEGSLLMIPRIALNTDAVSVWWSRVVVDPFGFVVVVVVVVVVVFCVPFCTGRVQPEAARSD